MSRREMAVVVITCDRCGKQETVDEVSPEDAPDQWCEITTKKPGDFTRHLEVCLTCFDTLTDKLGLDPDAGRSK